MHGPRTAALRARSAWLCGAVRSLALLALGAAASPPAVAQEPEVPVIEHQALRCVVKDRFPLLEAFVRPAARVTRARVYFTSSAGDEYYSVDLRLTTDERFEARLPKPKSKAGPVIYFLEVLSSGGELQRTPEVKLDVVSKPEACPEPDRVAPTSEGGDVEIYASTPRPVKPRGFGGVARVVVPADAVPVQVEAPAPPAGEHAVAAEPTPDTAPTPKDGVRETKAPPSAEPTPAPTPTPSPAPAPTPTPPAEPVEYGVGPDDLVKVVVVGHDDLSQTLVVQADGTVIFPLIGRIDVAGQTPRQLEALLTTRLGRGYIRNPQVSVSVQEYRSKTVMVMGEVARPGPYPLSGNLRIVEMLAKAGMTNGAGSEVQVIRPLGATDRPLLPSEVSGMEGAAPGADKPVTGAQAEILKVDLRAIQLGDLEKNIALRPNDTVFVPPAARFYVTGEARNPGAYTLTTGITVREAVILAGGFSDNASAGRTRVIREVDGQKREIKVKLEDPVQPGDIIVVKGKLF